MNQCQLAVEIVNADMELVKLAATLKAKYSLPYAGCFAGALAGMRKAVLITGDRDFKRIESTLTIVWL